VRLRLAESLETGRSDLLRNDFVERCRKGLSYGLAAARTRGRRYLDRD
jgi:hypothetical protein